MFRRGYISKGFQKAMSFSAAVALLGTAGIAQASLYNYTDLSPSGFAVPPGGYGNPEPLGGTTNGSQYVGDVLILNGHYPHPIIWNTNGTFNTDLYSSFSAHAVATTGGTQIGYSGNGESPTFDSHAILWKGTPGSFVDLHPVAFNPGQMSSANGLSLSGNHQVGFANGLGPSQNAFHAMLWNNTAASAIDLNPTGYVNTYANATTDTQQVGEGATVYNNHALLWTGTAASVNDLHPYGLAPNGSSQAQGLDAVHQVGYVNGLDAFPGQQHAYMWTSSSITGVDLNPTGFTYSEADGVFGNQEVGKGYSSLTGNQFHALLWNGASNAAIDLHLLLPANFQKSWATSIDGSGNVFGFAFDPSSGTHAIEWSVNSTPEPASLCLLGLGAGALMARRRGKQAMAGK